MQKYNKPPLTIDKQVELLRSRGLEIEDEGELRYYLENISYYHLSIYFKYYQDKDNQFYEGKFFRDVLRIYKFDNRLRFLLLEMLERIEKSFKCRLASELSLSMNDPHWFLNKNLFAERIRHEEILKFISAAVNKSREISIVHYKNKYNDPILPPIWMSLELLSFGECVTIFKSLKVQYRHIVGGSFGEDELVLMSWFHCLSNLRNLCAHHSRLWNRYLTWTPKTRHREYGKFFVSNDRRLFNHLVIAQIMLSKINPTASLLERLKANIGEFGINVRNMGFPDDWEGRLKSIIDGE